MFLFFRLFILAFVIISSVSAVEIACGFEITKFGRYKTHYTCRATEFHVESRAEQLTGVSGTHIEKGSNENVGILLVVNKTVHYLPQHMEQHLPRLYHLDLNGVGLKAISSNDMLMFPNLRYLYIRRNEIEELPEGLFNNNKELQFINLNDNKIKRVALSIFDAPYQLVSLTIEGNICIDDSAMGDEEIALLKAEIVLRCPLASVVV
jgi:hypothetical protein